MERMKFTKLRNTVVANGTRIEAHSIACPMFYRCATGHHEEPTVIAGIRQCALRPVWHTCLPMYLSDNIESIQKRCLRTIFPGHSYDEARSISNLQLYLKDAPNCDSRIFGKCTTLITSYVTVVPAMNVHPRDQAKVSVHDRWLLIRGAGGQVKDAT